MARGNKIALIGAGHMGGAIAAGWLRNKRGGVSPDRLIIIDPAPTDEVHALIEAHDIEHATTLTIKHSVEVGTVVLAIKPQALDAAAEQFAPLLAPECAIVSILAGTSIKRLEDVFGHRPIIRAMPNVALAIGKGMTVCVANEVGDALEDETKRLLKVTGAVEWVQDERMIGPVTAVSGSGPAYVFLLAEALAGAGFGEGLPQDLAEKLACQTIIGAGALLEASGKDPQALRRSVTSPNGTTQAALDVLMGSGGGLPELVRQAVNAAERRSRQMSSEPTSR